MGLARMVMIVLLSISSVTAPEAENIAMNNPERKSVDNTISLRNLLSSLIEYIVRDGLISMSRRAARIIIAYTGCLIVSVRVFPAIVSNLLNMA